MYQGGFQYKYFGCPNGTKFEMDNTGAYFTILLDKPTKKEMEAISDYAELRLTAFADCLWFMVRFDGLGWMDAPFNPNFSTDDLIQHLPEACSNITITLVDTSTAKVMFSGKAEISESVASGMIIGCEMLLMSDFDTDKYDETIAYLQNKYDAVQLAKTSFLKCSLDYSEQWTYSQKDERKFIIVNILDPMCGQTAEEMLEGIPAEHGVYRKEKWEVNEQEYAYYQTKKDPETGEVYLMITYENGEPQYRICARNLWEYAYTRIQR